jgi:hypothetical protein
LYLATGDFNGDGLTDLVVSDTAVHGAVFLLLSNGDGTFSKTGLSLTIGLPLLGVATGDLNGDGFLDLVTSNGDVNDGITVLMGDGNGTFQAPVSYGGLGVGQGQIVAADFNGDGIADLASADETSIAFLLGKGDGTFENPIAAGAVALSNYSRITSADLNGDGIPDLASSDGSEINVLLTTPTKTVTTAASAIVLSQLGMHQVAASYPGDSLYQPSVSAPTELFVLLTPTLTTTLSTSSITTAQPISAVIAVSGGKGNPTPTGYVTVIGGSYGFGTLPLTNGSVTFTLPGGLLKAGVNTLSVNYQPDATSSEIYSSATSTASVNVTMAPLAATPTFSPTAGMYSSTQTISISDATRNAVIHYTTDGSDPTTFASAVYSSPIVVTSSETIKAIAAASGYADSFVGAAIYSLPSQPPVLGSLSPAFASAGGPALTLTVTGSGFSGSSIIFWGTIPLATQLVHGNQLEAQLPASDTVTAGTIPVTVQTTAGGFVSNILQFEIDSATTASTAVPVFSPAAATIAAGSTATYPVVLLSTAMSVSATCLNLPAGATCSYPPSSGAVGISTLPTTPAGTYTVTVVFTETEPGTVTAVSLLPILLLPLACLRRRTSSKRFTILLGILLLLPVVCISACGGSSAKTETEPVLTHQVTSSATVSLTVQ